MVVALLTDTVRDQSGRDNDSDDDNGDNCDNEGGLVVMLMMSITRTMSTIMMIMM